MWWLFSNAHELRVYCHSLYVEFQLKEVGWRLASHFNQIYSVALILLKTILVWKGNAQEHHNCQFSLPEEESPSERLKFTLDFFFFNWEFGTCLMWIWFPRHCRTVRLLRSIVELNLVLYILIGSHVFFWGVGNFSNPPAEGSQPHYLFPIIGTQWLTLCQDVALVCMSCSSGHSNLIVPRWWGS